MTAFKLKLQLICGDEIAMGPGKADLLDRIREKGSISAAARAMDMSYRRAWLLVDAMNRCWREPLVETSPGSSHGHGARLTPFGEDVLGHYRALLATLDTRLGAQDGQALTALLRPEPLAAQTRRPALQA